MVINKENLAGIGLLSWSCGSKDKLLYDAGVWDTYYWYIAAHSFTVGLKTDYNLFGTPIFQGKLQYWDGSSWVDYGSTQTVDNAWVYWSSPGDNRWKWRLAYWHTKNSYAEYLYGSVSINGIGSSANYDSTIKGKLIGRTMEAQHQYKMADYEPSSLYLMTPTVFRGSLITSAVPARCFVCVE